MFWNIKPNRRYCNKWLWCFKIRHLCTVAIVITCPGDHKLPTSLPAPLHFIYHKSHMDYPGISDIRRVDKNKDRGWYFISLKVGHSVEDT